MLVSETNEDYHSSQSVSRSGLWKLYSKTPHHYKYEPRKPSTAFDVGTAQHTAILEPHLFDSTIIRGPADRRGNAWKELKNEAEAAGKILLTASDYDQVRLIRDIASRDKEIRSITSGKKYIETSAYHKDEETGVMVKCRPDVYNLDLSMMIDVKTAVNASPYAFEKSLSSYGYHMQEAFYTDVWSKATGHEVEQFVFILLEKGDAPLVQCYVLDDNAVAEGRAVYRKALEKYAECHRNDHWPSYGGGFMKASLRRFDYAETTPEPEEI